MCLLIIQMPVNTEPTTIGVPSCRQCPAALLRVASLSHVGQLTLLTKQGVEFRTAQCVISHFFTLSIFEFL